MVTNWENKLGDSISVGMEYYNEEHREALQSYPTAGKIQEVVKKGIAVPVPEFLTYFCFTKLGQSHPCARATLLSEKLSPTHTECCLIL